MSVEETKPRWANIAKILPQLGSPRSRRNSSNSASLCAAIKRIRTVSSWRWRDGSRMTSSLILTTCSGSSRRLEAGQLYWEHPVVAYLPCRTNYELTQEKNDGTNIALEARD